MTLSCIWFHRGRKLVDRSIPSEIYFITYIAQEIDGALREVDVLEVPWMGTFVHAVMTYPHWLTLFRNRSHLTKAQGPPEIPLSELKK